MQVSRNNSSANKTGFQRKILLWYRKRGRMFPWRAPVGTRQGRKRQTDNNLIRNPYNVLVSEVMLQQTQVDRVISYYKRWMRRWPTVGHLARARLASVIKAWAGLGYNRRAVYLHKAAIKVVSELGGEFPRSEEELVKLPGVGRYTARAILAFASRKDVGVLETNTKRVLLRIFFGINSLQELKILFGKEASATSLRAQRSSQERAALLSQLMHQRFFGGDVSSPKFPLRQLADRSVSASPSKKSGASEPLPQKAFSFGLLSEKDLLVLADAVVPKGRGDEWNQALMDFGAMVCTAKRPKCEECLVKKMCAWYRNQMQNSKLKSQNYNAKVKTPEKRERFEETDRYFRGRIVDALRGSSFSVESLREYLEIRHGLSSRERFDRLISNLGSDGLIKVDSSRHVSLP